MRSLISVFAFVLIAARCLSFPIDVRSHPRTWLSSFSLSDLGLGSNHRYNLAEPPRIQVAPSGQGQGWLTRWLSMGGEGSVTVCVGLSLPLFNHLFPEPPSLGRLICTWGLIYLCLQIGESNLTLPHRPAAFPPHLSPPIALPIQGFLTPFSNLPRPPSPPPTHSPIHNQNPSAYPISSDTSNLACIPSTFPPIRCIPSKTPYTIALIERGECDFATKVKAAQERGVSGVIVGDGRSREGESEEEGRGRENLITMFSPGRSLLALSPSHTRSSLSFSLTLFLALSHRKRRRVDADGGH